MENIGWNYDHVNKEGKNVFIFRDTCHKNPDIQTKILDESCRLMFGNYFKVMFSEGFEGHSPMIFYDPSNNGNKWNASEVLSYRFNSSERFVFGVEQKELLEKHLGIIRRKVILGKKQLEGSITLPEYSELFGLQYLFDEVSKERSYCAVEAISTYMRFLNLDTAGLVYGDGHFEEITDKLKTKGIGYSYFYPGAVELTPEEAFEYSLQFMN
ncbi:Uncharacterised protein [uncultured archaeon]|nr:Uncharacterised protein [uncultured archaeon]